jgi:hypothetical protein
VLGVPVSASRMDVERAGQKLLAQLEIGAESAKRFDAGGQQVERTPDLVRAALTTLRDPDQRLEAELLALATVVLLPPPAGVNAWDDLGLGTTRPRQGP